MSEKYEKQIYLAMLAEQCNRFEDMTEFLEDMIKQKTDDLNADERNLLSIAFKSTISLRRQAVRTLSLYETKERKREESLYLAYIIEYKNKIEKELLELGKKIIRTIDSYLIPKATDAEGKVFYHKMKADYYRYMAENVEGEDKKQYSENSLDSYKKATDSAKNLGVLNPIRLGLSLNFSVFYYEVIGSRDVACQISKETLDEARKAIQDVDEDDNEYQDAFSIINLLQENLNMWNIESE
jgi:14-3-3 protein epsilon